MTKHIYLALVLHNNQPLGNFSNVYEENFKLAYEPIIAILERYPGIKLTLHYTGSLLDWIKAERPQFIGRVRKLVERGQIEILSGGYYEPILASIPDEDKIGQIQKLSAEVEKLFGTKPQGMWLAERVWEPSLAKPIAQAGIHYTIVDDTHFKMVGKTEAETLGYYLTEEQGYQLAIFPGPQTLRYTIPWESIERTLAFLHSNASENGPIAAMGDDGEKFGSWPGTFELVYQNGWLENFFKAIEQNSDWLYTSTLENYYKNNSPLGRIYLPTASYAEMMEWSLPAQSGLEFLKLKQTLQAKAPADPEAATALSFIRGGIWRNFLVKYPEINTEHKKMYYVHHKVKDMPPGEAHEQARDYLWQGQCNETYWHGVFGGVYLPHLRTATYAELIQAEILADRAKYQGDWLEIAQFDFDYDGKPEVLVSGSLQNLYFDPAEGGSLFEWDFRPRHFNLLNVLSRRPEAYHERLLETARQRTQAAELEKGEGKVGEEAEAEVKGRDKLLKTLSSHKEGGLETLLHYDWYRRASFLDHFLIPETDLPAFYRCDYPEQGDFVDQPYLVEINTAAQENTLNQKTKIRFWRDGQLQDGPGYKPLRVEKEFTFEAGAAEFEVHYTLTNSGPTLLTTIFGFETNYGLNSGHAEDSFYTINQARPEDSYLDSMGESSQVKNLSLENGWFKLRVNLSFDQPAELWRFPIETIQNSEAGFERVYQASCLLAHWSIRLEPGQSWQTHLSFKLEAI